MCGVKYQVNYIVWAIPNLNEITEQTYTTHIWLESDDDVEEYIHSYLQEYFSIGNYQIQEFFKVN